MVGCCKVARSVENWILVERLNTLLTYSQFCKTSKNFQSTKQGLLSVIPEAAICINFVVNLAIYFRTPILISHRYYIDNHIQKRCSKKSRKIHGKTPLLESLLIKLQVSGLQFYLKDTSAQVFSCEFWKISKNTIFTEHLWTTG